MTDNFELYRNEIILRNNPSFPQDNKRGTNEYFYVIELMRRGKDNPTTSAANYHFKNYYIYSLRDLNKYRDEIKLICDTMNMRAYASVNAKYLPQIGLDTIAEMTRRIAQHDYKNINSVFSSCSGKYKQRREQHWVIDLDDNPTLEYVGEIESYIQTCTTEGYDNHEIVRIPTKSGIHLIVEPFDKAKFADMMGVSVEGLEAVISIKENHLTLLYENVK